MEHSESGEKTGYGTALFYLCISNMVVASGMILGVGLMKFHGVNGHTYDYHGEVFAHWDGQWYKLIADKGYSYDASTHSSVAFFPAYPLLGRALSRATRLSPEVSLAVISNLSLLFSFILFAKYLDIRSVYTERTGRQYSLLCLGMLPPTFFFRMAYSESLFLLITLSILYTVERRYPPVIAAILIGLGTATRPVGVCFLHG